METSEIETAFAIAASVYRILFRCAIEGIDINIRRRGEVWVLRTTWGAIGNVRGYEACLSPQTIYEAKTPVLREAIAESLAKSIIGYTRGIPGEPCPSEATRSRGM